ncbi:MAG: choline dehydrogenase-like flavoprotein [Planctomycetota bacterium]|jgi:choline dehydrogenase-like flavoprotein
MARKMKVDNQDIVFDVCVVGSGAGAGPIIFEMCKAGKKVVVLEKGPWLKTIDLDKDEMKVRKNSHAPKLKDEFHIIEQQDANGDWYKESTFDSGWDWWKGSLIGGSSNFMSGYFHRLKPNDFKPKTAYENIENGNIVDWPISYEDLEPYYEKTERIVGVSGKVVDHERQEPRSTPDFPYPPLAENEIATWLDEGAERLNYKMVPIPRAILSRSEKNRNACVYSNFCGSYGCASDAKGSSRVSLIDKALATGNLTILADSKVFHLETNGEGKIIKANYYNKSESKEFVTANIFVVACRAIETSRLLLMSKNKEFPYGLANNSRQVGKNLLFSAGGSGSGYFYKDSLGKDKFDAINKPGLWVNRSIHKWYEIEELSNGKPVKGGVVDFIWEHANPMMRAIRSKWSSDGSLLYGKALKENMKKIFTEEKRLRFEIFIDWIPNDNNYVSLDYENTDKWGDPVANIRISYNDYSDKVGEYIAKKSVALLKEIGAKDTGYSISGTPPSNLIAGGCRFGNDPKTAVLDKNCKAHEVENLYVTDGSFMPTGGSVTYTWSIYANSFRVADKILEVI